MARGLNKVQLIGHLGADPEVRYTNQSLAIANLRLATAEQWRDRQSGESRERTEWHRVIFFGKLAEIVGQYCRKGSKLYVEGRLRTRKWQDQNGQDRYTTEISGDNLLMLDGRQQGQGQQPAPAAQPQAAPAPQQPRQTAAPPPAGQTSAPPPDDVPFSDDIPW